MTKKSLINKVQIIEKNGESYVIVYAVRGYRGLERVVTIGLYFSKEVAEQMKKFYADAEIYDVLYIVEKNVWF